MTGVPPVVLIAFNRPEATRKTFDAIRAAAPADLFVICDAPRADRPGEAELCAQVRDIVADVDWPCEVRRIYRTENHGVEASVELGLDEVFAEVGEAMVFEDDCVADPSFFRYCAELLDRYRHDPSIAHIAGSALDTPAELFEGASYAFSSIAASWGWATWADRWQAHRRRLPRSWEGGSAVVPDLHDPALRLEHRTSSAVTGGFTWFVADRARRDHDGSLLPWDVLWGHYVVGTGSLAITPSVNMVENVGFNADATHTTLLGDMPRAQAMAFPLVHPASRAINVAISREVEFDALWVPVRRVARTVRKHLQPGAARTAALKLLTSTPVIRGRTSARGAVKKALQRLRPAG